MAEEESILFVDGKVEPAKLAALLQVNVSLLYQEKQSGRFGTKEFTEMTYREALSVYRKNLVHAVEVKLEKEKNEQLLREKKLEEELAIKRQKAEAKAALDSEAEQRRQERADRKAQRAMSSMKPDFSEDFEDTMHPLVKKKLEQEIKLSKVKEVQAWLKVAEEKRYFLYGTELTTLLEPFLHVIKNILISLSTEFPETEEKINNCMNSLHDFGERLVESAEVDETHFVDEMLSKDVDDLFIEMSFMQKMQEEHNV